MKFMILEIIYPGQNYYSCNNYGRTIDSILNTSGGMLYNIIAVSDKLEEALKLMTPHKILVKCDVIPVNFEEVTTDRIVQDKTIIAKIKE